MKKVFVLFDKELPFVRNLVEKAISTSGYSVRSEVVYSSISNILPNNYDVVLVYITSSTSLLWSFLKKVRTSDKICDLPIIGIMNFHPEIVGNNYQIWKQYDMYLTDYVTQPIDINQLREVLKAVTEEL